MKYVKQFAVIGLITFIGGLLAIILKGVTNDFIEGVLLAITLGMIVYITMFELLNQVKEIANKLSAFFDNEHHKHILKTFPNFDICEIFLKSNGEKRSRVLKADIIKKNNLQEDVNFLGGST